MLISDYFQSLSCKFHTHIAFAEKAMLQNDMKEGGGRREEDKKSQWGKLDSELTCTWIYAPLKCHENSIGREREVVFAIKNST